MPKPSRSIPGRGSLVAAAASALLFLAGCTHEAIDHQAPPASGPLAPHPTLTGREEFFDGRIAAELTFGPDAGFVHGPGDAAGAEPGPGRRHHGGGEGFHPGEGGGHHHGGGGEPGRAEAGPSDQDGQEQAQAMRRAARAHPPQLFHLRFTNRGPAQAALGVADFLSPLGNFVVSPDQLTLDPGQTLAVDPMTTLLADEVAGITITLVLKLDGRSEKRAIPLAVAPASSAGTVR